MPSHQYEFQSRDVLQLVLPTLVPLVLFAVLMHAGATARLLPNPRPTLDVDRTIVVHQAEASRSPQNAEVLLIGDSSCLMSVDAAQLTKELQVPVLNLGTLSHLGLESHAGLLKQYFAANPGRAKAIVLLMHPESLRLVSPNEYYTTMLDRFLAAQDSIRTTLTRDRVSHWLGFEIFRGRILSRLLPIPFRGAYGRRYGFSVDLERYLVAHRGSALDPEPRKFQGNPEYRLAQQFEPASRVFRAALPADVKLYVGVTPAPQGFVQGDYPAIREAILKQWATWLRPDAVLTDVSATLPDALFVKTTHLSAEGNRRYTSELASALKPHVTNALTPQ